MKQENYESFVKAWMESTTISDVCKKTGLSPKFASVKASSLRKKGVKLPKLRRQFTELDIDGLNKLITQMSKRKA